MPKQPVCRSPCSQRPQASKLPRLIPQEYYPGTAVADEYTRKDPDTDDCHAYVETANKLSTKSLLPTFDVQYGNYIQWPDWGQYQSIQGLGVKLASGAIYPSPLCHHASNRDRPLEWCTMSVVRRHREDLSEDLTVVGYLTPLSHSCIYHPIHTLNKRRKSNAKDNEEWLQRFEETGDIDFIWRG